jgi:hypothetical protein
MGARGLRIKPRVLPDVPECSAAPRTAKMAKRTQTRRNTWPGQWLPMQQQAIDEMFHVEHRRRTDGVAGEVN